MEAGGWAEANLVYLPYCSSDAHMGDTQVMSWGNIKDIPPNLVSRSWLENLGQFRLYILNDSDWD